MVTLTTLSSDEPAASSTAFRFSQTWRVSAVMPPTASLPVRGSLPSCPDTKIHSPRLIACESGTRAGGTLSVWITCFDMSLLTITGVPASVEVPPRLSGASVLPPCSMGCQGRATCSRIRSIADEPKLAPDERDPIDDLLPSDLHGAPPTFPRRERQSCEVSPATSRQRCDDLTVLVFGKRA